MESITFLVGLLPRRKLTGVFVATVLSCFPSVNRQWRALQINISLIVHNQIRIVALLYQIGYAP